MCIRDRYTGGHEASADRTFRCSTRADRDSGERDGGACDYACLLYTSDAADEPSSVDLGGRRIIKKKNKETTQRCRQYHQA